MINETCLLLYVGSQIRKARNEKRLNQSDLGLAIGLSRTSVVNIEGGRQNLPMTTLCRIAVALDTEIAVLLPTLGQVSNLQTVAVSLDGEEMQITPLELQTIKAFLNETKPSIGRPRKETAE